MHGTEAYTGTHPVSMFADKVAMAPERVYVAFLVTPILTRSHLSSLSRIRTEHKPCNRAADPR